MAKKEAPQQLAGFEPAKLYVWVKGLESKVNNLLREVDVLKNDFMRKVNNLNGEFKVLNEDLLEIKRDQEIVLQKMDLVIKELKKTAGVEEVMIIKKYLDYWNPLHFVTQRDLERAIESKLAASKIGISKKNK